MAKPPAPLEPTAARRWRPKRLATKGVTTNERRRRRDRNRHPKRDRGRERPGEHRRARSRCRIRRRARGPRDAARPSPLGQEPPQGVRRTDRGRRRELRHRGGLAHRADPVPTARANRPRSTVLPVSTRPRAGRFTSTTRRSPVCVRTRSPTAGSSTSRSRANWRSVGVQVVEGPYHTRQVDWSLRKPCATGRRYSGTHTRSPSDRRKKVH